MNRGAVHEHAVELAAAEQFARWSPLAAIERVNHLGAGDPLAPMLDIANPHDAFAVAVRTTDERDRFLLGYVPRYLARDINSVCQNCAPNFLDLRVERLNPGAPLQMRLLCRMRACWPENFKPCAGEEFQPIVSRMASAVVG